ncbi:hypothetical protein ZYGNAAKF_CDS0165 [Enterococcus phage VRE9_2]
MAIKIVGPIKELTENEDLVCWVSPTMDVFKGKIFQKEDFTKVETWSGINTYIPKSGGFTYAKRWVLDTEDIRSDWFKHE